MTDIFPSRDQTGPGRRQTTGGCESRSEPRLAAPSPCTCFADLLVDLSDGELPHDQQQAVRDHVSTCPGCRAELARLDASLAQLASGIVAPATVAVSRRSRHSDRHIGLAVAATSLVCLGAVSWLAWSSTTSPIAKLPVVVPQSQPLLSPADALRQIALVEQCARLQTSLNLMPNDPAYADQRATNERLLVKFQEAAADTAPRTNNGEAL